MEDVGKTPEPTDIPAVVEAPSIPTLDGWIENLMSCKQLSEGDVQKLCDKVGCSMELYLQNSSANTASGKRSARCRRKRTASGRYRDAIRAPI